MPEEQRRVEALATHVDAARRRLDAAAAASAAAAAAAAATAAAAAAAAPRPAGRDDRQRVAPPPVAVAAAAAAVASPAALPASPKAQPPPAAPAPAPASPKAQPGSPSSAAAAQPGRPKRAYKVLSVHALLHPSMRREFWSSDQFEVTKRLHKGYASEVFKASGGREGGGGGSVRLDAAPGQGSGCASAAGHTSPPPTHVVPRSARAHAPRTPLHSTRPPGARQAVWRGVRRQGVRRHPGEHGGVRLGVRELFERRGARQQWAEGRRASLSTRPSAPAAPACRRLLFQALSPPPAAPPSPPLHRHPSQLGKLNKAQLIREIKLHGSFAHRNIVELWCSFQASLCV
jgi:hypothetical protein